MEAHINTVPNELLTEVFRRVISVLTKPPTTAAFSENPCNRRSDNPRLSQCKARSHLRLVCRHWNGIILSDPWFWSQISITISGLDFFPLPPPRLVEKWLERSGGHPLDIFLDFIPRFMDHFTEEKYAEDYFNRVLTLFLRKNDRRRLSRWRTKLPKSVRPLLGVPTYKSSLHSNSGQIELESLISKSGRRAPEVLKPLVAGYFTFNIWPLLERNLSRWRSLTLICEMNVLKVFLPALSGAQQLSELTLTIYPFYQVNPGGVFSQFVMTLGHITSLRRLKLGAPWPSSLLPADARDLYDQIPDSTLCLLTHLEVTGNLLLVQVLALMKNCRKAQFIKIPDIDRRPFDTHLEIGSLSKDSYIQLSCLNALILSVPWHGHHIFEYMDLPNLRLLSLVTSSWTDNTKRMLMSSLGAYITAPSGVNFLQMLHLNHQGLSFNDVRLFLSQSQVQAIPIIEIDSIYPEQCDDPPIDEESALREILSTNPSFSRRILIEENRQRPRACVVGWVDEGSLLDWEENLREWGMQLDIVDAHRRRHGRRMNA